jgi:cysteine desulfurase
LDENGISASTGSACSANDLKPSHVISALGGDAELVHSSVRFSLGRYTKKSDIDYTIKMLHLCVNKIRNLSSVK